VFNAGFQCVDGNRPNGSGDEQSYSPRARTNNDPDQMAADSDGEAVSRRHRRTGSHFAGRSPHFVILRLDPDPAGLDIECGDQGFRAMAEHFYRANQAHFSRLTPVGGRFCKPDRAARSDPDDALEALDIASAIAKDPSQNKRHGLVAPSEP
jgi:hypothetical protein